MAKQRDLFGYPEPGVGQPKPEPEKASKKLRELAEALDSFPLERIKAILVSLNGEKAPKTSKRELVLMLARMLDFGKQDDFDSFMASLPAVARKAVEIASFARTVGVKILESEFGSPVLVRKREYAYHEYLHIAGGTALDMFDIRDEATLVLPYVFRMVFCPYLPKPANWNPAPIPEPPASVWSNEAGIADSLPLVLEALKEEDAYSLVRKGFQKTACKKFREKCGIPDFPVAGSLGLSAAELAARFFAAFSSKKQPVPSDPYLFLKRLVEMFFDKERAISFVNADTGRYFEFRVLSEHFTKKSGSTSFEHPGYPIVRKTLLALLKRASSGEWYSVESLFDSAWYRNEPVSIIAYRSENEDLRLKGSKLVLGKAVYESDGYYDWFYPTDALVRDIHSLPLFRAYLYLFAALGLIEISEKEPPSRLVKNGKKIPVSMYDGLEAIRLTPSGLWCLDFASVKPKRVAASGLVLADANLPILTIQGKSLEKRIFLDSIGVKLDEERYRVTEASFISGCAAPKEIERRIERFGQLVSSDPPPRWKSFFDSVRAKSGIFAEAEDAFLFKLPANEGIRNVFFSDIHLKALARKAEGGYVAVKRSDWAKLAKILSANGFYCPPLKDMTRKDR